ncbi:MAG: SUMF1/EgtB/PvdO family nonheme iron enzyme [Pseudomonadota bacterium]
MDSDIKKIGKYDIVSVLGEGAMGIVYKGIDPIIKRFVAIKTIRHNAPELDEHDIMARFVREAQAAGRLHHPNIVGIYEYGQDTDRDFIVMEFVEGLSLSDHLEKHPHLEIKAICDIMSKVLEALDYAHSMGIVHRDIKPGNIILADSGAVKVADFGIARIESSTLTKIGTAVGTPAYMSPEQLLGQHIDHRSDIFSAGTLLYKLLTEQKPFTGPTLTAVLYNIVHGEHILPTKLKPELAGEFNHIIARALAKKPEERFQTAKEFAAALDRISEVQTTPAADHEATVVRSRVTETLIKSAASSNAPKEKAVVSRLDQDPAKDQAGTDARTTRNKRPIVVFSALLTVVLAAGAIWFFVFQDGVGLKTLVRVAPDLPEASIAPVPEPIQQRQPAPSPEIPPPGQAALPSKEPQPLPPPIDIEPMEATFEAIAEGILHSDPSHGSATVESFPAGAQIAVTGKVKGRDWLRVKSSTGESAFAWATLLQTPPGLERFKSGETFKDCATCPEMVMIPAGAFMQGSPPTESEREQNEGPQRHVRIDYPLAVGRHEITKDQFAQFVNDTDFQAQGCWGYDGQWERSDSMNWAAPGFDQNDDHPVTCVSWNDTQAYVRWLSDKTRKNYRLLSASEWEYTARSRSEHSRTWGDDTPSACDSANVADLSSEQHFDGWDVHNCRDNYVHTAPVGSFKPNDFGLYDVLGNVFEWVQDCWNDNNLWAPADGSPQLEGDCEHRELRGGSWFSMPRYVRLAFRNRFKSDYRSASFGFRVARVLDH